MKDERCGKNGLWLFVAIEGKENTGFTNLEQNR